VLARLALAFACALVVGCGDGAHACVKDLPSSCDPLYPPEFHELFTRTLHPTCAVAGPSCHSSEGGKGGMVYETEDVAYSLLLERAVVPGDPACSLVVEKLTSSDPTFQMPPGAPLSPAEQCVVISWIRDGAKP